MKFDTKMERMKNRFVKNLTNKQPTKDITSDDLKYKIPIIALGLGEKEDDLEIFDSKIFANTFVKTN